MSNAKNINEVSVITSVDSGDYVMVSDISDDSLKRATVTNVGKTLLGTTDISAIGDGSVTGAISDLDSTKVDKAGDTMTGTLNVSGTDYGRLNVKGTNGYGGILGLYGGNGNVAEIFSPNYSAYRQIYIPDASGTFALTSDLATQTSTISPNTYTTANTVMANSIIKCGNMVHLNLMMTFNERYYVPTNTAFATIPTGYRPSISRPYAATIQAGGAWYGYVVTVDTSGQIKQGFTSNCQGVCISIAYEI